MLGDKLHSAHDGNREQQTPYPPEHREQEGESLTGPRIKCIP
jgi:hypothetical protein